MPRLSANNAVLCRASGTFPFPGIALWHGRLCQQPWANLTEPPLHALSRDSHTCPHRQSLLLESSLVQLG